MSRPAPSVRRIRTDRGLLLLDTASNALTVYNDSARLAWDLLEEGCSGDEIAAEFVKRFAIPEALARRDVGAILGQWRQQGLVAGEGAPAPTPRPRVEGAPASAGSSDPRWAAQLTCTIRNTVFRLSVEDPAWISFLQTFFSHLETSGATPDFRIDLRRAGERETAIVVDGIARFSTADGGELIGAVNQIILEHLHPDVEWLAIIHGAAVARDGVALAFPAACGSGKTTLTAYLISRGYTYLADDHVALSAPEGRVVPWPMPLSLKAGSWDILSETYRDIGDFPTYRSTRGEARQLVPSARVWETDPVPARHLVFPRYAPDADAALTPIAPFEALERLLGDQIWLGYPMSEEGVRAFLDWLEDTPAYTLVHGNVADAARCIERLM